MVSANDTAAGFGVDLFNTNAISDDDLKGQ
jgi:hypothetical protein